MILLVHRWRIDQAIAQREHRTSGTIVSLEPQGRDRVGYSFSAEGRSYIGRYTPLGDDAPAVGQHVTVYYDPTDPDTNGIADFGDRDADALGEVPLMIVGIGLVASFIYLRRRTLRQRSQRP